MRDMKDLIRGTFIGTAVILFLFVGTPRTADATAGPSHAPVPTELAPARAIHNAAAR